MGSSILFTYPQIATIAGVQGLVVYALSASLPLLVFAWLGPIIREQCPEGFVLTEWTIQRYGLVTGLYLSLCTLLTLFLYMVAELSALQQVINALTGLNGLPVVIVECFVTTVYTSLAGFKVSFITDNIQAAMVLGLLIISVAAVGSKTTIDRSLIPESGLLNSSLLGWQLIYILPVAILTNNFFLSGFWLRTFASRSNRDLYIGVSLATGTIAVIFTFVGATGLLAAWSGVWPGADPTTDGSLSFFLLLAQLPTWLVGIILVLTVALSTSAFDSLQSAIVSSASNDLFRNRLNLWLIRASVVALIFPVVIVALKSPNILTIYLISDLLSAAVIPVLVIGLWPKAHAWRGCDVVVGGLGGIFSVFLFGLVFYQGDARAAGNLILLKNGLYADDWSAFGAFVAAPVGGLLWGAASFGVRVAVLWVLARVRGTPFTALDRPVRGDEGMVVEDEGRFSGEQSVERRDVKNGQFF
ncbi:hypothetical protein EJ05DRAFT_392652 [Pseudovirgaria hyperparasitica]|uniref:Urea transporter n=1 Tax=Pseudovirgaria hyperparasitica TaxID=470096 RepID=A0A6A6W6J0_9PEZI|nr:uncharacterized protein EJ05DRAFT_392652 [Pseudovirgaria hyperparasitica]KAF2757526.1 hypothetical protein EJ05DRAFT_392652 [Pseudovirgaria hyperparasitica]